MMAATFFPLMILLGAPEREMEELDAMQIAVRAAVNKVSPSVVTILTTGGIRHVEIPDEFKKKWPSIRLP